MGTGIPDLFFVNGAPWPGETPPAEKRVAGHCALFRNDGRGHFTDVSHEAGLDVGAAGHGRTAGDYDNDGHPDLFVACVGRNHLFRNRGDGTFEDVTLNRGGRRRRQHVDAPARPWVDFDGDGKL